MAEAPLSSCPFLVNLLPEALAGTHTMEASLTSPAPSASSVPRTLACQGPHGRMWLLSATVSPGQAQASAVCLPWYIRCSPSHLLGSLVIWSLSCPPPPALTASLYLGARGACTVNQVFTFILNDFLGTNHVFYLCTFYISVKIEMENFASG